MFPPPHAGLNRCSTTTVSGTLQLTNASKVWRKNFELPGGFGGRKMGRFWGCFGFRVDEILPNFGWIISQTNTRIPIKQPVKIQYIPTGGCGNLSIWVQLGESFQFQEPVVQGIFGIKSYPIFWGLFDKQLQGFRHLTTRIQWKQLLSCTYCWWFRNPANHQGCLGNSS